MLKTFCAILAGLYCAVALVAVLLCGTFPLLEMLGYDDPDTETEEA